MAAPSDVLINLNKSSNEPLFTQVSRSLATAIETKEYLPGQQIPTEPELAEFYGVSRITIRRAIDELAHKGLLVKRQGKGTFVGERRMSRKVEHLSSFTESCIASGMVPTATVVRRELLKALPAHINHRPEFGQERILYIQRIHYADGNPVMIENNYYPLPKFEFLQSESLEGSLFETLWRAGIKVAASDGSYIDAIAAPPLEAQQLALLTGDPIFVFYTEMLDDDGDLVYIGLQQIAASRYRFAHVGR